MVRRLLCFALLPVSCVIAQTAPADGSRAPHGEPPQTVAEASAFERTGTYEQVMGFLRAIEANSDRAVLSSIGRTVEGREIPLMVIADPPVASPEEAARSKKLVILLFGNIHAGEVCGKEALQMLARELTAPGDQPLLKDLIVCLVPIYNADGNERFSPDNRPGQNGPMEMGQRGNAAGFDLNRDWVKMDAPETRALVRFMNRWDPAVVVDTHTTNGSHHRYLVTYQGPKHPAGDHGVVSYVRDTMLPAIDAAFEESTGQSAFWYGNFEAKHTLWTTYPAEPRYGVAYRGMRNRLSLLSEAYAYASFEDRVTGTLAFCRETLRYSATHAKEIRDLIAAADRREIEAGQRGGDTASLALRVEAVAFKDQVTALGFEEYDQDGNRVPPGAERDWNVELVNDFRPTLSVKRAWGYIVPRELNTIAQRLQWHGIRVEEIREDAEVGGEVYRVEGFESGPREFEGHRRYERIEATAVDRTVRVRAGDYLVRSEQPLGGLAGYLLEPQATDGFAAWGLFPGGLEVGSEFAVVRLGGPTPLTRRSARALPEDLESGKRITFEEAYEGDRINLNGSPVGGLAWIDDEHLLQNKDGAWWKVHAASGRMVEEIASERGLESVLSALPSIDEDAARGIARRFSRPRSGDHGSVFSHANDLYYLDPTYESCVRLTSSPEEEEEYSLSPDGQFVAYVQDNNLWVVDIETRTPRALTMGGTDALRKGKASWLYFEEVFGRDWKAYWWSPDGQSIVYLETNSDGVPRYTIVDDSDRSLRVEVDHYARPGERNPHVEAYIVSRMGGTPRRVDLSGYDHGQYLIAHVAWEPDSSDVLLYVQNRVQTWMDVLRVSTRGGRPTRLLRDRTDAWVEPSGDPIYLRDGSFVMFSERDGWKHLYRFAKDGSLQSQVTSGEFEVRSIVRLDEDHNELFFTGTVDGSVGENLYRIGLDGAGLTRLTKETGDHRISMNAAGTLFVDTWSDHATPTRVALRNAETGAAIRWIDTNPVYEREEFDLGRIDMVRVPTHEGVDLEGVLVFPPDFDASRRYPVWLTTYAGPHAPTVRDSWQGGRIWEQVLAEAGVVVFRVDPYPASGKGAKSAWTAYRQLGVRELSDLEQAVGWLCNAFPWADPERIGLNGYSYGGFMTSFALTHSTKFSAGIAGGSVTDWRDYDSIYTERYMDTPQENPEGYEKTSVVAAAKDLHGQLLLVHGAIDDNVHPMNTMRLAGALQSAGKLFEMAVYPGSRHGIGQRQFTRLQYEFIRRTMRPGDHPMIEPALDSSGSEADTPHVETADEPLVGG
ncbi:MAG: DPP IV N-terminal domain-containing protein [Phycisphaeraceae bacterium]|nr:DPP IV N-terminal domain-containing protein [Phycisphaeraceae bacterium]